MASDFPKDFSSTGFAAPHRQSLGNERHTAAFAELLATVALAVSTLIVATVLSIGIARADVADSVIDNEGGLFVIALLLGVMFIGMGGATILSLPQHRHKKTHS